MNAVIDLASRRPSCTPTPEHVPAVTAPLDRILRIKAVKHHVGLSRATIYRRMGKGDFPASVPLGGRSVGWRESEISGWIAARGAGGEA